MINFLFGNIGRINKKVLSSFKKLPADKYEKSKGYYFRYRRYSRVLIENNFNYPKISFLKKAFFYQEKKRNRYAGGKQRIFKPINKKILQEFIKIYLNNFNHLCNFKKIEIGFHQLRIKCSKEFVGYPVPEGWHKDGFNYVIIINFDSKNIEGGITRIKNNLANKDSYSNFLKKSDYIFLNDNKFYHYTDPINITKNSAFGFRDTLVVTIKKLKN